MSWMNGNYRRIRKHTFTSLWDLDKDIISLAKGLPSHGFLANPSGLYPYVYLTQYVKALSQYHFGTKFSRLKILDWGCGKGHVSKLIRDLAPEKLESCDILSELQDSTFGQQVPIIEKLGLNVTPLTHDFVLPFADGSFDIVLSFGVLEHVPNDAASLAEIQRILKPNGLFFCFYLPAKLSWTQRIARSKGENYHDRLYTERTIRDLLSATEMQPIDLWYRQLLPKNTVRYPAFRLFERMDQLITESSPLRYLATNVEFVAVKTKSVVEAESMEIT